MKKFIIFFFFCAFVSGVSAQSTYWNLTGNSSTTTANFIGTTDCQPLIFKAGNVERMRLKPGTSSLGIGVIAPQATLHLHYHNDAGACGLGSESYPVKLLQLTTPLTGSGLNNGFTISSSNSKEIIFKQQEQAKFTIEGPSGGLTIAADGNIGVNTGVPQQKLHVADGNILISKSSTTIPGLVNCSVIFGDNIIPNKWGIRYLNSSSEGYGLEFWKYEDVLPGIVPKLYSVLFLANNRYVGIGTDDPQARLDVDGSFKAVKADIAGAIIAGGALSAQSATIAGTLSANELDVSNITITETLTAPNANITGNLTANNADITENLTAQNATVTGTTLLKGDVFINDGVKRLSIGDAYSADLAWGNAYIGFNATRNNGNWTTTGGGTNNGGGIIWSTMDGSILFASIPSTGGSNKTLTDTQIKQNVKLLLTSDGILKAKDVLVIPTGWPDFVFEKDYNLLPLNEVEQYITENQHLPSVPSAAKVEANGINLGEMNAILLQKVEELTLYIIEQEKQMKELEKRLSKVENKK
jgi:hypothetical protein